MSHFTNPGLDWRCLTRDAALILKGNGYFERLNAGLSGHVTLLSAPAGFGKTTLLVEWVQTIDRRTAWLSLDDNDNELAAFVHALTAALQSLFPDACQASASLLKVPQFPIRVKLTPDGRAHTSSRRS